MTGLGDSAYEINPFNNLLVEQLRQDEKILGALRMHSKRLILKKKITNHFLS
jgi:hypothetical protein